jgi:hypothetical protein
MAHKTCNKCKNILCLCEYEYGLCVICYKEKILKESLGLIGNKEVIVDFQI